MAANSESMKLPLARLSVVHSMRRVSLRGRCPSRKARALSGSEKVDLTSLSWGWWIGPSGMKTRKRRNTKSGKQKIAQAKHRSQFGTPGGHHFVWVSFNSSKCRFRRTIRIEDDYPCWDDHWATIHYQKTRRSSSLQTFPVNPDSSRWSCLSVGGSSCLKIPERAHPRLVSRILHR